MYLIYSRKKFLDKCLFSIFMMFHWNRLAEWIRHLVWFFSFHCMINIFLITTVIFTGSAVSHFCFKEEVGWGHPGNKKWLKM